MIYLRLTVSVCVLFNIGIEAFLLHVHLIAPEKLQQLNGVLIPLVLHTLPWYLQHSRQPQGGTRTEEQQQHPHPLHGGLYLETEVQVQSVVSIPSSVRTVKRRR